MSNRSKISVPHSALAALCARHGVRRLALFGSVLRDDFGPDSDVDVLVEFEPSLRVTYFSLARLEADLGTLLGRRADVHLPRSLHPYLRERVLAQAEDTYVGA
jgi:hypothetical protein